MAKGEWRNGLKGVGPHESVNAVDFYEQYHKNKEQWDSLFKWLATTDLLALPGEKFLFPAPLWWQVCRTAKTILSKSAALKAIVRR